MFKKQILSYSIIIIIIFGMSSCKRKMDTEAMQLVQKMTLNEKIGQMLMLGVAEKNISKKSISLIENNFPGGIILFGYNIGNMEEIKKFIRDMQKTAIEKYKIPLFISIDQEGGRVKRIKNGVTQFPGNIAFGVVDDKSLTHDAARILGLELRKIGINMNLAPVLDVNNNPSNPVINTRSFGSEVSIVSNLGVSYIKGLQESKCIAVGKHFPGHGDTDKDSHLTLPVINYNIERLQKIEFPPFIKAIDNGVEAIMTAHISFPNILKNYLPATLSKQFLTEILRNKMNFQGIIITDDMEMNAVSKLMDLGEAAVESIKAGADIILISTHGASIDIISKALKKAVANGTIPAERIDESVKRIIEVKLRYDIVSYKNGVINYPENILSKKDLEILKTADELNKRVTREAVYYYSGGKYPLEFINNNHFTNIVIISNELFKKEIELYSKNNDIRIFNKENDFLKFIYKEEQNKNKYKNLAVYYQFDSINAKSETFEKIIQISRKLNIKLYLLCTGNPYELRTIKALPPVLFTFSNTHESFKQLISCLKGEFKPRQKINTYLGFN